MLSNVCYCTILNVYVIKVTCYCAKVNGYVVECMLLYY